MLSEQALAQAIDYKPDVRSELAHYPMPSCSRLSSTSL
jgi:hypothetical protein